jgi:hypothetical protein
MSFIAAAIGAGAAIAGGAISAKGAKDSAKTASRASERDLEFQREGRDLARQDQAGYRQAGNTALDALMSMTGLGKTNFGAAEAGRQVEESDTSVTPADYLGQFGKTLGSKGRKALSRYQALNPYEYGDDSQEYFSGFTNQLDNKRQAQFNRFSNNNPFGRAMGGSMQAGGSYNINEIGPENVYSGGGVTRWGGPPQTVQPSQGGYVQPNATPPTAGAVNDQPYAAPQENPGGVEGGYNFMTDPGYEFRIGEGQRALERGAAARGGLLSGGYGRKAQRYGQDYASNEYNNVFNRISAIAGIGQSGSNQSGNYAMNAGYGMGTAAAQGGYASAYGQQGASNAWANAGNQIAQLPWGNVFSGNDPKIDYSGGGGSRAYP